MDIGEMLEMHPNKICIIKPKKRRKKNGFVKKWKLLRAVDSVEDARRAIYYYEQDGVPAVPVSTCEPMKNYENLRLPPDLVAKYFRCLFDKDYSILSENRILSKSDYIIR